MANIKNNSLAIANTTAATTAVVFVICRVGIGLFPDLSFTLAQSWFHGIELTKLGSWNLTTESFVLGLVSATVGAWLVGYLFAAILIVGIGLFLGLVYAIIAVEAARWGIAIFITGFIFGFLLKKYKKNNYSLNE